MKKPGQARTELDRFTYKLIGLAMEVHNELGSGHREHAYHEALLIKFRQTDFVVLDEPEIWVELADGSAVQKYVPDFIINDAVIVEIKAQHWPMTRDDMAQVFDYFAGDGLQAGIILQLRASAPGIPSAVPA